MRILHTSDWHLGRSFHGVGMLTHQAAFTDHLLEVVRSEGVDLVVVAGDVYDRALPPVDAVEQADETFARLADSGARTVVTSGNHDSARRLGFGSRLIDRSGVHLRTDAGGVGEPVLVDDEHGTVAVHGIPYLVPDAVREPWHLAERSHRAALGEAMRRVRVDLDARPGIRSVVLAHAFVTGGEASESERDITVGGVADVPCSTFDGVDYVALGHLHGRQTLSPSVRYSGSPLAYSFSEAGHRKGSWLVDLGAPGSPISARFIDAPVPRPLVRIEGRLDDLLADPRFTDAEQAWLQVGLTDAERPAQARDRLLARFPHLLSLHFAPAGGAQARRPQIRGRSDRDLVVDFVAHVRGAPATNAERGLLHEAVECCARDPEADVVVG